ALSISAGPFNVLESGTASFALNLIDEQTGNTVPAPADFEVRLQTQDVEATGGLDYVINDGTGTITFPAGESSMFVRVATLTDSLIEGDESFQMQILEIIGAPDITIGNATGVAVIKDGQPPATGRLEGPTMVDESAGTVSYDVVVNVPAGRSIQEAFSFFVSVLVTSTATESEDFSIPTSSGEFPDGVIGEVRQSFTVDINDDPDPEDDETINFGLSFIPGTVVAVNTLSTTIGDNDTGGNNPPEAQDDLYAVQEDDVLLIAVPGVLDNDSDPNGDPLTAQRLSDPSNGALIFKTDGSFEYRPQAHFNGTDSFTYRAVDSSGAPSDPTTVTIEVIAVNDAPVAADDAYFITQGASGVIFTVAAPGVLANDSDADGEPLEAQRLSDPANGSVTFNPDGSFVYVPNPGFSGTDSFLYRVVDPSGTPSGTARVTIEVAVLQQFPTANPGGPYQVDEGRMVMLDGSQSTDPDGTIVTYEWDFDGDGQFDDATGPTPTFDATMLDGPSQVNPAVRLRVTDDSGLTDEASAVINVANVAPMASLNAPTQAFAGVRVGFSLGASDPSNADQQAGFTYQIDFGNGSQGAVSGPDGTTIRPVYSSPGTFIVTLTATDKDGGQSEPVQQSITIFDTPAFDFGDAPVSYGTLLPDGARHVPIGPTLGAVRDAENDGRPNGSALGDDLHPPGGPDDEDGLVRGALVRGCGGFLTINVQNVSGEHFLAAWVDFDGNGVWTEEEQVSDKLPITENGDYTLDFSVPASAPPNTFARVRLSSTEGLGPTGGSADGEVEDYRVTIAPNPLRVFIDDDWLGTEFGKDPDGSGPARFFGLDSFFEIQPGVDCVRPNGTVLVHPGIYLEGVFIPKPLTLQGAGVAMTKIFPLSGDGVRVSASGVTLRDFAVKSATGAGIRAGDLRSFAAVANLTVSGVAALGNGEDGMQAVVSGQIKVDNSEFNSNRQRGLSIVNLAGARVNSLNNVTASENGQHGLSIAGPAEISLSGGSFVGNQGGFGIDMFGVNSVRINGVGANGNRAGGLRIEDTGGKPIHITDAAFLDGPEGNSVGLFLRPGTRGGLVVLTNVAASGHELGGLQITDATRVRITGGFYNDNRGGPDSDGIQLTNIAIATLQNVTAENNGDDGLDARTISILNVQGGQYNNNGGFGIERNNILVRSILTGVTTNGNAAGGVSGV
ncbi:MAG: Ig-like domain-containing protein, partial [Planctomycetaceae bacterium]